MLSISWGLTGDDGAGMIALVVSLQRMIEGTTRQGRKPWGFGLDATGVVGQNAATHPHPV